MEQDKVSLFFQSKLLQACNGGQNQITIIQEHWEKLGDQNKQLWRRQDRCWSVIRHCNGRVIK